MARDDVNIKVSANVAEAVRLWQAMEEGPEGMARALEDTGRRGKQASRGMGDELDKVVGKWVTIGTVVNEVRQALQRLEEDSQAAANATFSSLGAMGELAQVSKSPEEMQRNLGFARSLVQRGIVAPDNLSLAADITGQFLNVELSPEEMEMFAQVGESRLVQAEGLGRFVESLRKYQRTFGEGEAGNLTEVLNKLVQAGEVAQTKLPDLANAATQFGSEAAALGFSDEETLSAFLAIEARSPNEDIAATRLRSLLNQIDKRGLGKGTLAETLLSIQGQGQPFDVLGESRAVAGFRNIMDARGFAAQQQALLESATERDVLGGRLGLIETDPQLQSALRKAEAEGELADVQGVASSQKELLLDAFLAERKAKNIERFGAFAGGFLNLAGSAGVGLVDVLQLEEQQLRGIANGEGGVSRELQRAAQQHIQRVDIRLTGPDGRDVPHEVEAGAP